MGVGDPEQATANASAVTPAAERRASKTGRPSPAWPPVRTEVRRDRARLGARDRADRQPRLKARTAEAAVAQSERQCARA